MSETAIEEVKAYLKDKKAMIESDEHVDYFELFGIPSDATSDVIQKAYFQAAKMIHPDRLERLNLKHLKPDAGAVFQTLTEAYNILNDVGQRMLYLRALESRREGRPDMSPEDEAKIYAHRGEVMLSRREYDQAEGFLRKALELLPKDNAIRLNLAWAVFQNPDKDIKKRAEEARELVEPMSRGTQVDAKALYLTAQYYKVMGDMVRCKRYLDFALQTQPDYVEAQREKRLLEMRAGPRTNKHVAKVKAFFEKTFGGSKKTKASGKGRKSRKGRKRR